MRVQDLQRSAAPTDTTVGWGWVSFSSDRGLLPLPLEEQGSRVSPESDQLKSRQLAQEKASDLAAVALPDLPPSDLLFPAPERSPIILVDDEPSVLRTLGKFLRSKGYPVEEFGSARESLEALRVQEASLLVTDISMPGMGGIELAQRAMQEDPDLAIIIITGVPTSDTAVSALRLGVADYLEKPFQLEELRETVQRTLRRRGQASYRRTLETWLRAEVELRTEELQRLTVSTLASLVRAMEAKDPFLRGHSKRVAAVCAKMAEHLIPEGAAEVRAAGLLHDIGKIQIRDSVLTKEGELTEEEYEHVKVHPQASATILRPLTFLGRAIDYVRSHHERLDGSGYPEGLQGDEISLGAQIVGVADSYVSLTEDRRYRPRSSPMDALETLKGGVDSWYDRRVLDALEQAVAEVAAEAVQEAAAEGDR